MRVLCSATPRGPRRRSMASLALTGTATASAPSSSATTRPSRSPGKKRTRAAAPLWAAAPPVLRGGPGQHEWAIGVAVGGEQGVGRPRRQREALELGELGGADVLGIDGHEGVAAPDGEHLGAERPQDARDELAPDGGVLV